MEKENLTPQEKKKKAYKTQTIVLTIIQFVIIVVCIVGAIFVFINSSTTKDDPSKFNTSMMTVKTDSMEPTILVDNMIFSKKFKYDENTVLDIGKVVTYAVPVGNKKYNLITHRIVGYYYHNTALNTSLKVYGNQDIKSFADLQKTSVNELQFVGYLTRGDKYTLEFCASFEDFTIRNEDNSINYNKDDIYYSYLTNDQVLSVWSGRQSRVLGKIVVFLQEPNHLMLTIVLPIILLIVYNLFLIIREIIRDKKDKAKEEALKALREDIELNEDEIKKQAIEEYLASLNNKEDDSGGEEAQEEN